MNMTIYMYTFLKSCFHKLSIGEIERMLRSSVFLSTLQVSCLPVVSCTHENSSPTDSSWSPDFRKVYMYGANIMVKCCNMRSKITRFEKKGQYSDFFRSKLRSYVCIFGVLAKTRYFGVKIRAICHEYDHIHVYLSEIVFS